MIKYACLTVVILAALPIPMQADIVFMERYESGVLPTWPRLPWGNAFRGCCSYSGQVVNSPVRAGQYAARFELRYSDPSPGSSKRSELIYFGDSRIGNIGGADEWYGFSTYFPPDYKADSAPECVAQWHAQRDQGEAARTPVLAFNTQGGNWHIQTMYSSTPIQTSNDGTQVLLWKAPHQTGVWIDWVVHVKWSYQSGGFVEIWKDGVKIVNYKGPNAYNDQRNIYFQWGIYKWPWANNQPTDVTHRVVYNDELRIGNSNSSYAEVAPPIPDNMAPGPPMLSLR